MKYARGGIIIYNIFSKIFAISVILLFVGTGLNTTFASINNQIPEEMDKIGSQDNSFNHDASINHYPTESQTRIFLFCEIEIFTTGRAFLFPGYLDSLDEGINVSTASGFCFVGNKSNAGSIKLNGIDINNWRWMFIAFFTGFIRNHEINLPPRPQQVFTLVGTAVLVLVSYKS